MPTRRRFDGEIAAFGTTSGYRVVVGRWPVSPFGSVSDVMIEAPDGTRLLIAPNVEVAHFVASTYRFDSVEVGPVEVIRQPERLEEWYGAWDHHRLRSVTTSWRETDLGSMTDVFRPSDSASARRHASPASCA